MYRIYLNKELFCDSRIDELAVISPEVTLEVNKAGSLEFTMPPDHPYYDSIQRRKSYVEVYRDEDKEPVFAGICTDIATDFYRQKKVTFEGELTYFNDTVQRPQKYQNMTVRGLLETYIAQHNQYADEDKQFTVGDVTVRDSNDYVYCYTNYDTTMESIKEDLLDDYGGYLRIRHENGTRYLDYLADPPHTSTQCIRLGENLLELDTNIDLSNIATEIIPLGADLEESTISGLNERVTIKSVNNGIDYVTNEETVKTLGNICKVVTWENVTTPEALKQKAEKYLKDTQFDNLVITATAIDLHFEDKENEHFKLLDNIRVVSKPHGIDRDFVLSKMTLNLNDPENDTITLGQEESGDLSEVSNKTASGIANNVSNVENNVSDLKDDVDDIDETINGENGLSAKITKNEELLEVEMKNRQDANSEMSTKISETAKMIETEAKKRQDENNEMSTRISQCARSVKISASNTDKEVGITIQLYNENGDLITGASDTANVVITGMVMLQDLARAGATTINGANITTGKINCDFLSGGTIEGQDFHQNGKYGEVSITNGHIYVTGDIKIGNEDVATEEWVMGSAKAKYAENADNADFATECDVANFADIARHCSNTAKDKHTANMYSDSSNTMYYCPQGSSRRFKTDIAPVTDDRLNPHRLYDVDVVQFKYRPSFYGLPEGTPMETVVGIIAEDIHDKYPCACEYDEETGEINNWMERYMIPPMLTLIQEQHEEIEAIKKQLRKGE